MKESSGERMTLAQVERAQRQAARISTGAPAPWQFVGPTNVGGRVVDLAIDPTTSPSTVFAAVSSGGGIMKSTDGGVRFTPAYPDDLTQSMGALARGSDGTLWAGTGEANPSGGGQTHMGDGLYTSSDGGDTWRFAAFRDSGAIGRIVVNPQNPQEIWVAATGSLQWVSSQRGLYHSTDGGRSWQLSLVPINDKTGAIDVAIDPDNPNIILASLWDRYRNSGSFYYGGSGSGLYRSTDDGRTWTRIDNTHINGSLCAWDQNKTGLNTDPTLGRIGIAFAPGDGNRAYIEFSGNVGPDKGLLRFQRRREHLDLRRRRARLGQRRLRVGVRPLVGRSGEREPSIRGRRQPARVDRRRRELAQLERPARRPARGWRGTRRLRIWSTSATTAASIGRARTGRAARGRTRSTSRGCSRTTSRSRSRTRRDWWPACRTRGASAHGGRASSPRISHSGTPTAAATATGRRSTRKTS